MRVLIVGAGAVGQAYGAWLTRGGAQVGVLVKPKHALSSQAGFTVHLVNSTQAVQWTPVEVLTEPQEVGQSWDQLWLCVPATGVQESWLQPLLASCGHASVVSFVPGRQARELLERLVPGQRLAQGLIPLLAWQAPLEGESFDPPGVAVWLPPLAVVPIQGAAAVVNSAVAALKAGGCRAAPNADVALQLARINAAVLAVVASLECAGWSLRAWREGPHSALAAKASRQGVVVTTSALHASPGLPRLFMRPWLLRWVSRLAPALTPFDLERYLAWHFTKVGEQTRVNLEDVVQVGRAAGHPVDHVVALLVQLQAARAGGGS